MRLEFARIVAFGCFKFVWVNRNYPVIIDENNVTESHDPMGLQSANYFDFETSLL